MAKADARMSDRVETKAANLYSVVHGRDANVAFAPDEAQEGWRKLARTWIKVDNLVDSLVASNRKLKQDLAGARRVALRAMTDARR